MDGSSDMGTERPLMLGLLNISGSEAAASRLAGAYVSNDKERRFRGVVRKCGNAC